MIALLPLSAMINNPTIWYGESFAKVDDPRSNFGVIINDKNTASYNFMCLEV